MKCLLDPEIKRALQKIYQRHPKIIALRDHLTDIDYETLEKIFYFLKALYDATVYTEGHTATLDRVLPSMEFVLDHFEKGKILHVDDPFLGPYINSGWSKLNDYYALTNKSLVYVAAIVLDPYQK